MARHPAIALLEFGSVTAGIVAGDAMVKRAPVALHSGTVQPGHYLVLIAGEVGDVEEAVDAGTTASGDVLLDLVLLSDVHPDVVAALRGARLPGPAEALGIIETQTVASILEAADAGVKGAAADLLEVHLADGLGGRGYLLFGGTVSDVEAAVDIGSARAHEGTLVRRAVISRLHDEMRADLDAHPRFGPSVGRGGGGDAAG
ncbi:MAG: BMC domain-containing protein [Actinobacteria bacterium]|nr:BMC domain-containing protein [Actinomycetota bacterium]